MNADRVPGSPRAGFAVPAVLTVSAVHAAPAVLAMPAVADVDLQALRADLAARAGAAGLLDVAYRRLDSPVGALLLAATPVGLVRIAFDREDFDAVLQSLADTISPRVLAAPGRLDAASRELEEYFAGHRRTFDLALDRRLSAGFRRRVQDHLSDIEYGRTASYAAVAAAVGNPLAVRAVGTACATNPLPLVLPCHRVVRSDGRTGAYRGGPDAKEILLRLESAA